jgi:hypothetical protein
MCVVSDRPERVCWDEAERPQIHSEDGPAVRYRDGWSVYAVHGVRVPEYVIECPQEISVEKIRAEDNSEVKRIMRERYGEGRYLADIGATVIDTDMSPTHTRRKRASAIMRALLQDDEGRRFLVGTDGSTRRAYHMEIPAEIATCRQAHEFLGGIDENKIIAQS